MMADTDPESPTPPVVSGESSEDIFLSESPVKMTLERIITLTGEIGHLNDLVVLYLDCNGGYTGTEEYFSTVRPILDRLELEIRCQYEPGMSRTEVKQIISAWIDSEICSMQ